ncbi:MAG: hypothetical protein PHV17_01955 [Candidatus Omnitrophica bacterium]|nr:hypothetical protein [Candidatus Omnitrophota bacterium]
MLRKLCIFLTVLILSCFDSVFSAEVYYFGSANQNSTEPGRAYTFKERLDDLTDFSSGRSLSERSGKISGSILIQAEYDKVLGNKSKSFLRTGWDYLSEINLNLQEKLWSDYSLEGQLMMRKTDNPRIEVRSDLRVKEYSLKISNPDNLFIFGDFYGELSPFTLGSSLEGHSGEIKLNPTSEIKYVLARKSSADIAAGIYQRNVFGFKVDTFLFKESEIVSNARIGVQAVTNQDDSSTAGATSSFVDLRNSVFSVDGDISFVRFFSLNYEVARSIYLADEDSETIKDQSYGSAAHLAAQFQVNQTILRHVFNYAQPDFYTDSGSSSRDRIQHQLTLDHRFNQQLSVSLMENYYWDHLSKSTLSKRTINDEKSVSLNILPLSQRETFRTRVYSSYNLRDSDDIINSLESRTFTAGFSVNDKYQDADIGFSYEYRAFTSQADKSLSDYFNRIGMTLAREYSLLQKRLYLSLNPALDIRRTKNDSNHDLNISISFSGQYDLAANIIIRFGHNLIDSNSAKADNGYSNNRSFAEVDWTIGKNKNRHLVLRGDINRYSHEDGALSYKERQAVIKYILNF